MVRIQMLPKTPISHVYVMSNGCETSLFRFRVPSSLCSVGMTLIETHKGNINVITGQ